MCVFFEGGVGYEEFKNIPIIEFYELVKHANTIQKIRDDEIKKAK